VESFSSEGRSPVKTASRIHMAVLGSSRPRERYSAIPSMNQRGVLAIAGGRPGCCREEARSNWNACTSSCPSTWSFCAAEPVRGSTTRSSRGSVNPPVPCSRNPKVALVCWKSGASA
jgi:hypothetical protein